MADNPVDKKTETPKAVDVLAAAAGAPTPAQAKGPLAAAWRYRKLALLLGGFGVAGAAGGYGYKYFTATPPKANAQADPPAVAAKPEETKPSDEPPAIKPPTLPTKPDVPAVPDVILPDVKMPDAKVPAIKTPDKTDTEPPPILPPGPVDKPKKSAADGPPDIAPPPDINIKGPVDDKKNPVVDAPTITLPNSDKRKPAPEGADPFKATDKVPTDDKLGPAPLPADVTDKKKTEGPVIRVQGSDPKVEVPAAPKVEVPTVPMPDKKVEAADPMIPKIDINLPPLPGADKKDDKKKDDVPVIAPPPSPGKTDNPPTIKIPGPMPEVPPVIVAPMNDSPGVKAPADKSSDIPTITIPAPGSQTKPPAGDPPAIPPINIKAGPPPAAPVDKNSYEDLWHDDHGEPYAAISREYYHDPKYAAALEAYNKGRRDKIIRVPPTWVLKDRFPNLVGGDKPEDKPKDNGLKFEPVSPLPSGRSAPPATETSRPSDEYRVTRDAGETIREVAQKVLGDGSAWKKLYDLNPNIDPTLPLPAGTILRLK